MIESRRNSSPLTMFTLCLAVGREALEGEGVCARPVYDTLPRSFPPENEKTTLLCGLIAVGDRTATVS